MANKSLSNHVQVQQDKEHKKEAGVLRQAPCMVPGLRKAEDLFRDEEDVLSLASGYQRITYVGLFYRIKGQFGRDFFSEVP